MNKRHARVLHVIAVVLGIIGTGICAIQFARAVALWKLGKCFLYFFLTALCIETVFFSARNLLKKRK